MPKRLLILFAFFFCLGTPVKAGGRLALLVGIENYPPSIGVLSSDEGPKKNVDAVQQALSKLGFEIETLTDSGRLADIEAVVKHFLTRLEAQKPEVSFFYYAGHGAGAQSKVNYIIPNDASLDEIAGKSIAINDLVSKLKEHAKETKHIVVIDACRDELNLPDEPSGSKGFNLVNTTEWPPNVLVAFATSPGKSAANSHAYASALASEIVKEGVELNTVFLNIENNVSATTKRKQVPDHRNGIYDKVFLAGELSSGPAGCCEPAGARRLVFKGFDFIKVYRSGDPADGLIEVRGAGSVIIPRSQNEVHYWRDGAVLKWVIFQTDWGVGYVRKSDVEVEH